MDDSLFLNINLNDFKFLTLSNKNKVIENLAFILFNEKNKYKSISNNKGEVIFKNIVNGEYILKEKETNKYKNDINYRIKIENNKAYINEKEVNDLKIYYNVTENEKAKDKDIYYYKDINDKSPIIENDYIIKNDLYKSENVLLYWKDEEDNKYYPNEQISIKEDLKLYPVYKSKEPKEIEFINNYLIGKGIKNSEIIIETSKENIIKTIVNEENNFKVKIPFKENSYFKIFQIENDMKKSDVVSFFV